MHVVGAAVRSFWEEHLVDGALALALLLLVILAVGVADAIVELTAGSVTLALIVIGAHAGAHFVQIFVNHAHVVGSRLRLGLVLFLLFVVAVRFTHAPAELGAVSVATAFVTVAALAGSQWVLRLINLAIVGLFLIALVLTHAEAVFGAVSAAAAFAVFRAHEGSPFVFPLVDVACVVIFFFFIVSAIGVGVARLDFHGLNVSVHGRGAISILDGDPDEALVTPVLAPGVLDDPVGLVTLVLEADNGDAVVETGRAVVLLGEDALLVVAPAAVASGNCDAQRSLLELLLHLPVFDLLDRACIGPRHDGLILLVSACAVLCLVLVGLVGRGADRGRHAPVVRHPATVAAGGVPVAVDAFLLGEADDWGVVLDGLHGFLDCGGGEGPAGAAAALVLHWVHFVLVDPVDGHVLLEATTATHAIGGAVAAGVGVIRLVWCAESLHFKELFLCHVAGRVHAECDSGAGVCGIEAVDFFLVFEPDLKAVAHLRGGAVALAEGADVVLELGGVVARVKAHSSHGSGSE